MKRSDPKKKLPAIAVHHAPYPLAGQTLDVVSSTPESMTTWNPFHAVCHRLIIYRFDKKSPTPIRRGRGFGSAAKTPFFSQKTRGCRRRTGWLEKSFPLFTALKIILNGETY